MELAKGDPMPGRCTVAANLAWAGAEEDGRKGDPHRTEMQFAPHPEGAGDDARAELDVDDLKGRLQREPSAKLKARLEPAQGNAFSHHVQRHPTRDDGARTMGSGDPSGSGWRG